MLPVYYTTTNNKKRKAGKKTQSQLAAERDHKKFLKKMGIGTRSSVGLEQRSSKPWVTGSSPVECANKRNVAEMSNDIPVGVAPKKELIPHNFTIAPAYNKGPYQVISKSDIKDIGR